MKTQLSSLELHYIVKELQMLINGRIDNIYQPDKKELILQFHIPNLGKKMLKIIVPNLIFLASVRDFTETPPGFCMFLRKYLSNARVRHIRQLESERIVEVMFEAKESKYYLIFELFSKGNIVMCKEDYTIFNLIEQQSWKDREVKKGVKYQYPRKGYNLFELKLDDLRQVISNSTRDSIVKTLAIDLGLGGIYAEESLLLSNIDKTKSKLDDSELKNLYDSIKSLVNMKIEPKLIKDKDTLVDIVPFDLVYYKGLSKEPRNTYNEALDELSALKLDDNTIRFNKKLESLKIIIADQETTIKKYEEEQKLNNQKGQLIYEKYQLMSKILAELKKAREKLSWQEIKEKLKGHNIIKEVNEKEGKVVVEV